MLNYCNTEFLTKKKIDSSILIVEDSEFVNDMIKTELEKLGHHCVQAYTLEEALLLIKLIDSCGFIILDLHLPDAYGKELFNKVSAHTDAKIIILTSESDAQVRSTLFKAGALDYILKDEDFSTSILKANETIKKISANIGCNILLIDDSTLLRKQIEILLHARNYTFLEAKTAQEGLDILNTKKVDLVILDLQLPDIHGLKVLETIKNNPSFFTLPVLILSGTNDPELISSVLKEGASDFIQKPFNIEEFVLKVDLWTRLTSKTDEAHYLQQLVKKYENTINQSIPVCITDIHDTFAHVNEKFCEMSGYTKEELLGKTTSLIQDPKMSSEVLKVLKKSIQDKKTWSGILMFKKKNGEHYSIDTVINPITSTSGDIIEYIYFYRLC